MTGVGGFQGGFAIGATIALTALILGTSAEPTGTAPLDLAQWLSTNLGHSLGLFGVVAVLFSIKLKRLVVLLESLPDPIESNRDIVALDQMLDVWTQVFIGIGVIWTAVGMRSALQTALGDPGAALTDDADAVLRRLVDGGILLALTTTIVGAVGGYLMRVIKTACVGAALQSYYEALDRQEIRALVEATRRIEAHLDQLPASGEVTPIAGRAS
jgi:hypothetical protein